MGSVWLPGSEMPSNISQNTGGYEFAGLVPAHNVIAP